MMYISFAIINFHFVKVLSHLSLLTICHRAV